MATLPSRPDVLRGLLEADEACHQVDLGEPLLATAAATSRQGLPLRAHELPHPLDHAGRQDPRSPCVYLHDYKVGNLLTDDIFDIVRSPQFRSSAGATATPTLVEGCAGCPKLETCRGGCAARSYLHHLHEDGERSLFVKDPYCIVEAREEMGDAFPSVPAEAAAAGGQVMVHRDYLCTWIGEPK